MTLSEPSSPTGLHQLAHGDLMDLESVALVLESVGIEYTLQVDDQTLWVNGNDVDEAVEQLQLYREENRNWPPVELVPSPHPQVPPTALVMGGLVLFYLVTGPWTENAPWFARGAVDTVAIGRGEWWRLVTGLTLHADGVHLLGNCFLGGVLVHLLSRSIGYGLAWLLLIAAGSLGNWCNVVFRQTAHLSVGFSTAVFAAVGILAGMQACRRRKPFWKNLLLPLGAGLALLALLGTEGARTDLGAHLFGFLTGLGGGILLGLTPAVAWCRPAIWQRWLFAGTMLVVVCSWWLAMG